MAAGGGQPGPGRQPRTRDNRYRTGLFQYRRYYVWDNRSDTATLRDDRGRTIGTDT
ncbi:hypothetical protein [Streptomyces erythrochromogenes]|uniref:hypothetical protein n=1 Tax=Streptomyces erythrochromogenes TaxID=285574 RepID=UPI00386F1F78|nr:hypothetical protein OG364_00735 [Streptomyces erythrochromogenes]WST98400.1 hypothetical protein OG364_40800 [Streptomyces erythrochromogenes]